LINHLLLAGVFFWLNFRFRSISSTVAGGLFLKYAEIMPGRFIYPCIIWGKMMVYAKQMNRSSRI